MRLLRALIAELRSVDADTPAATLGLPFSTAQLRAMRAERNTPR